jgi:hypothetical protein
MHRSGMLIETTFSLCIVLFLTIPRAPNFKFPSADIIGVDNSTVSFSRSPTNFSFAGSVNMIGTFATGYFVIPGVNPSALPADSTSSYLPVYFTNLDITVKDLTTNKEIATGNWRNQKLKRGDAEFVSLPVQFSYTGVNTSDTTCELLGLPWLRRFAHASQSGANMYNACGHLWTGTTRQGNKIVESPIAITDCFLPQISRSR